jgi:hypothetical protein
MKIIVVEIILRCHKHNQQIQLFKLLIKFWTKFGENIYKTYLNQ